VLNCGYKLLGNSVLKKRHFGVTLRAGPEPIEEHNLDMRTEYSFLRRFGVI